MSKTKKIMVEKILGCYQLVDLESFQTKLIQTDWDYPAVAKKLGYVPCGNCSETDGTVDCKHKTATQMILEAEQYLDNHIQETFSDPGYFD